MRVFIVAGETSGDRLGADLILGLRRLVPRLDCAGVGGPLMQGAGLHSLFPMNELSLMGISEIMPRLPTLFRRLRQSVEACCDFAPDVLITIDSPEFCLRLARRVRARHRVFTVHYVAPSVWAWRPGRARRMARSVDHVLALLPFEPPLMQAAGMTCDFVGHPVMAERQPTEAEVAALREALALTADPVLALLPGSRAGEVSRLMPVFRDTVTALRRERPGLQLILPTTTDMAPLVRGALRDWPVPVAVLGPELRQAAYKMADLALAASGSVSLELAAAGTPMVIAYDMAPLSRWLIQRLLRVDTVTLVNLVSGTRAVPEFLGPACQPGQIAREVLRVLDAPQTQHQALQATVQALRAPSSDPGLAAARSVLAHLTQSGRVF